MTSTVLFVPGLRDHVADHWQTLLAAEIPGARTVPPLSRDGLSCAARVRALDAALCEIDGPVVLVAHSAGVLMVAHWAQRPSRPVKAALLVTPADIERPLPPGYPAHAELAANGWLPVPRRPLPFPARVLFSDDDPLAAPDRVQALAADWAAETAALGAVGHMNPASGFGPWPLGRQLVAALEDAAGR